MLAEQAIELFNSVGKEATIKHFQDMIDAYGKPSDYATVCKIKGLNRVIRFVEGDLRGVEQDLP